MDILCLCVSSSSFHSQIDSKAYPSFHAAFASIAECLVNVIVSPLPNLNIVWGDISLLKAHLGCAEALLKSPVKWRYLLNFAASAFPLKSVEEMVGL